MRRTPNYPVLTFVACALVAFLFIERAIDPYVPVGMPNPLSKETAEFLQQGGYELIKWQKATEAAFAQARREEKPILMIIGAPWSSAGRYLDREILRLERVQRLLDRYFICIRIDSEQQPDWAGAYLPISRSTTGVLPDLQIYALTPDGKFLMNLRDADHADDVTENDFIDQVSAALSKFEQSLRQINSPEQSTISPGKEQTEDLAVLYGSQGDTLPDFRSIRGELVAAADAYGGYPVKNKQPLWPQAWMFEISSGGTAAVAPTLNRLLTSPVADPIDGGFYRRANTLDWTQIVFDKVATQNAEMALLMARMYLLTSDSLYKVAAEKTLDFLFSPTSANGLQDNAGFISPCRIGDEQPPFFRSVRSSFSPRRINSLFPRNDFYSKVGPALNYGGTPNPQAVPALQSLDDYRAMRPEVAAAVEKMRKASAPALTSGQLTLATEGVVAARSIEAARLLNDSTRLGLATALFEQLDVFRTGNEVRHELSNLSQIPPNLADYLAYCDGCLQDYLNLGRLPSVQSGFKLMGRTIRLYASKRKGMLLQALPGSVHTFAENSNVPQMADDVSESSMGAAIRLAWMYGELFRNAPSAADRKEATSLLEFANEAVAAGAAAANGMAAFVGGFALDSAIIVDGQAVFAVGKNPSEMAAALARKSPFRMIAPAVGPVRPDLQGRATGYYVSIRGKVAGPFDFGQAQKLLVPELVIGPIGG